MSYKKSPQSKRESKKKLKKFYQCTYYLEAFLMRNLKRLFFVLGVFFFIIFGYFAYGKFYLRPREEKALNHLFYARRYFSRDEIKKALGGDSSLTRGGYIGFVDIIEKFPSTQAANIARFYAGLSNYKLGNYKKAIDLCKDFSARDEFLFPMKYGIIAEAYLHLKKKDQAFNYYMIAFQASDNDFTAPLYLYKAAMLSFRMGKYKKAKKCFLYLKERYPQSTFIQEVDKYLSLIDIKSKK